MSYTDTQKNGLAGLHFVVESITFVQFVFKNNK